jgi:signal transduction histidine kinase
MINTPIKTTRCLAAASLLIVFILDIFTPNTFVVDILYLCCILLVFRESPRTILLFSTVACLLIVADVLLFELKLNLRPSFWVNRGMSIVAILIASNLTISFRKLNQASILKEQLYLKALEEILFITSHRVRKPLANIVGLTHLINADTTILTADDLRKYCNYLSFSANELDKIIKELNNFIEKPEQAKRALGLSGPIACDFATQEFSVPAKLEIVA